MIQVIQGMENFRPSAAERTAVAIGVFDGVHLGHQEILHQTVRAAKADGLTPLALTFDIHPSELFHPETAPPYIACLDQRAEWMDRCCPGLAGVVVARFDHAFASLAPAAFVTDVLQARFQSAQVLVGSDFRYGRGRVGTVETLIDSCASAGFGVTVAPPVEVDGERISSTQIRALVAAGDLPHARRLLGHLFVLRGRVVSGKRLGRTLGYPTANLAPVQDRQLLPANGVYAAFALLADGRRLPAAVSIGTNPTTDNDGRRKVEAYLMGGFGGDIYGHALDLDMRMKVRDEARFESLGDLQAAMAADVAAVEALLRDDGERLQHERES